MRRTSSENPEMWESRASPAIDIWAARAMLHPLGVDYTKRSDLGGQAVRRVD